MRRNDPGGGRAIWLGALVVLSAALPLHGQAALAPASSAAIEEVFSDIDESGPGCAVGVVSDLALVYANGFGAANLDYGLPITPRSNFYLGSVGKQFTAAAVAHAERAGHLSVDDPVRRWVPELPHYDPAITIRHLIHHTSGIRDYLTLASLAGRRLEDVLDDDDVLALLARQRATNFPAGERYLYSNSGYFLLSEIVERATGLSLRAYAREHLLDPLGMTRTRIHDDRRALIPDRVVGYEHESGGVRMNHPWNFQQVGSGGVYSSIEDLARWDRNYYTEEVGGGGFTARLLERGVLTDGSTIPYAFGLAHGEYRGLPTVDHGGSLAGFRSQLLRFPDQRTTILVLCNFPSSEPGARARRVADVVLADHLAPAAAAVAAEPGVPEDGPAVELTPDELDAFTGHWRASMGIEVEIRREAGRLLFLQGTSRSPLTVVSDSVLRLEAADIEMTLSEKAAGKYGFMAVVQRGQSFTARRFDPAADDRDYSEIVGAYYSEELDATYRLYETDGRLMVELPPERRVRAYLLEDGRVRAPMGVLEPRREAGVVVGFALDAGRARGILFERR